MDILLIRGAPHFSFSKLKKNCVTEVGDDAEVLSTKSSRCWRRLTLKPGTGKVASLLLRRRSSGESKKTSESRRHSLTLRGTNQTL